MAYPKMPLKMRRRRVREGLRVSLALARLSGLRPRLNMYMHMTVKRLRLLKVWYVMMEMPLDWSTLIRLEVAVSATQ